MIKKIFFQLIFFNFFFIKEVFAAESGGMPQLNPEFWISQIFWLTLTFGILYVVLSKLILPKISANLELRKSQIQENIETAEKHRESSETKLKEYDDIITKIKYKAPKVSVSQNICEIQNSGSNWGMPPLSAVKTSLTKKRLKNINWKNIFLIIILKCKKND